MNRTNPIRTFTFGNVTCVPKSNKELVLYTPFGTCSLECPHINFNEPLSSNKNFTSFIECLNGFFKYINPILNFTQSNADNYSNVFNVGQQHQSTLSPDMTMNPFMIEFMKSMLNRDCEHCHLHNVCEKHRKHVHCTECHRNMEIDSGVEIMMSNHPKISTNTDKVYVYNDHHEKKTIKSMQKRLDDISSQIVELGQKIIQNKQTDTYHEQRHYKPRPRRQRQRYHRNMDRQFNTMTDESVGRMIDRQVEHVNININPQQEQNDGNHCTGQIPKVPNNLVGQKIRI